MGTTPSGLYGQDDSVCVYWSQPAPDPAKPLKWECFNDGTCGRTADPSRAVFETEASCLASCASSFDCVRVEGQRQYSWIGLVPSGPRASVGYCLPSFPIGNRSRPAVPGTRTATFSTLRGCEEECIIVDDGRDWACHDWVFIIKFTLFTWLFSYTAGFFAAKNHVATRQKFSVAMKGCFCYEVVRRCCGVIPIPSLHCFGECSNGRLGLCDCCRL